MTKYIKKSMTALAIFALAGTPILAQDSMLDDDFAAPAAADSAPAAAAAAQKAPTMARATIAIGKLNVSPALIENIKKNNALESFDRIMQATSSRLESEITKTKRMQVIEVDPAQIDLCVRAIEEGDSTLAGVDQGIIAKFKTAQYIISIRIDDFQDRRDTRQVRLGNVVNKKEMRKIRIKGTTKVIRTSTREIVYSPDIVAEKDIEIKGNVAGTSEGGSDTEKLISTLPEEFCKNVAMAIADYVNPPKVIAIDKKGNLTINSGKPNVKKGQVYVVYELGEAVEDEDTGETICPEVPVGTAKVISVTAKSSTLKMLSKEEDMEPSKGNIVRLPSADEVEE